MPEAPPDIILASLAFAVRDDPKHLIERPYALQYFPEDNELPRKNISYEIVDNIPIHDIRSNEVTLKDNGLTITHLETKLDYHDFANEELVSTTYLREVREALRKITGVQEIYIFEWLIRRRDADFPYREMSSFKHSQPVVTTHIDYTPADTEDRIRTLFEGKAEQMLCRRYQFLNVWRPLRGPVHDWPLALCDAATVDVHRDLLVFDDVMQTAVNEMYKVHYSEKQKWHYLSSQTTSEAIVFSSYDSQNPELSKVPHVSFATGNREKGGMPRESIEVRAIVFFDQ